MDNMSDLIARELLSFSNPKDATFLQRFFKTAPGEYGAGDKFLGIRVPQTRAVVRKYKKSVSLSDSLNLIKSPWHEIRLAGFLLMVEQFKAASKNNVVEANDIVCCYLDNLGYGNNWDLVDLVAPKILGQWLVINPEYRHILKSLSEMESELWHQRVAIVATYALICNGIFEDTIDIAEKYLNHKHDLIHKATGWMLREVGKRGGERQLRAFLEEYAGRMPRTMLRYAIEKFPEMERQYYLHKKH